MIADHIVAEADDDEQVRVQYTVLKALALIQIGEAEASRQSLDALVGSLKPRVIPSLIPSRDMHLSHVDAIPFSAGEILKKDG